MIIFLIIFTLFYLSAKFISSNQIEVMINEISTQNSDIISDKYGYYSDWIELYNSGKDEINLSGFGLSNEFYIPFKWRFPKNIIIAPGEYLIVFASEQKSKFNELHTNFKLNKRGDTLFFTDSDFNLLESIEIPALEENETYGRTENNTFQKMIPTPGKKNQILIDPPIFSKKSGFYDNDFLLSLSTKEESIIYYTIDGSDPLNSDTVKIYNEPILIHDRTEEKNIYSEYGEIVNSSISISIGSNYKTPIYKIDKAMIIRAMSKNQKGYSKIIDHSYFITTGNLSLYKNQTIISMVINPDDLFSPEKGIYVTGSRYADWLKTHNKTSNNPPNEILNYFSRGSEWEREASITILEKGEFSVEQKMGIRIKGSSTRGNPGKSFNLFAKKKYGKSYINYKLFPENKDINGKIIEKYSSFSLICINSDGRLRNKLATEIIHDRIDLTTTDIKNGILFLNGEYWGMYIISEQFTDDFIETHYNIPKNNVAMNKQDSPEEGQEEEYIKFKQFGREYSKKDLKDKKNYEEVCNYFDIDSFIEHYAAGIYLGTTDWPNYNYGTWRNMGEEILGNKFSDGKWRFMTYDLDKTMGNFYQEYGPVEVYAADSFNRTRRKMKNPPTSLFFALIHNEEFRNKFINTYCDYVNGVMSMDKINSIIEDYRENTTELLANSLQRWRGYNRPYLDGYTAHKREYYSSLEKIRTYFIERPNYTLLHMKQFFNLTEDYYDLTIIKEGKGKVIVNTITPNFVDGKWKGKYYYDIPIKISAVPIEKNNFLEWNGDFESKDKEIYISLKKNMTIKVTFTNEN